jgi:hypothetical protein
MELTILTKQQFDEIIHRLDSLNAHLLKLNSPAEQRYINNSEFMSRMKISKRTAQSWRDEGKISFSQIGNKVYYLLSDVEDLFERHTIKAFRYKR